VCVCVCVCVCVFKLTQITFQSFKVSVGSSFAYISSLTVSLEEIFPLWLSAYNFLLFCGEKNPYYCRGLTAFEDPIYVHALVQK